MSCDECEADRAKGFGFCHKCGAPLDDSCPECDDYRSRGYSFCGRCGRDLTGGGEPRTMEITTISRSATAILIPLVILVLVLEASMMLLGVGDTWEWVGKSVVNILLILPTLMVVGTVDGLGAQILWVLIVIAIVVSLVVTMYQSIDVFSTRKGTFVDRSEPTPLYWITLLFSTMLVVNLTFGIISALMGYPLNSPESFPSGNNPDSLFSYADAAVWEEIISRVMLIGVPMAVAALALRRKKGMAYLLGGFGMSRLALILLIISSFLFGYAHSGGWGLVKVIPASIGGFAMGYLYIRFGLHAAIVFHFLTDYLAVLIGNSGMIFVEMLMIASVAVGILCLINLVQRMRKGLDDIQDMPNLVNDQDNIWERRL